MANLITSTELVMLSQSEFDGRSREEAIMYQAALNELHEHSTIQQEITIFLSHSHSDKVLLESFISILNRIPVTVYLDWMDDELTFPPSGITAERIKEKIKENRKFILLATVRAISSKWCNWELGLGDAAKYDEHIALFPVADSSGWDGNEYLQIYPYITKEQMGHNIISDFFVIKPNGDSQSLSQWLKN